MRTQAAMRILEPQAAAQKALYLGPATVQESQGRELSVALAEPSALGEVVTAKLALAFPYEAQPGDVVLVVGDGSRHFVIGVIEGSGATTFELPGDVELRARGKLRLASDEAVAIDAPRVHIETGSLRVLAGAVVERFQSLRQRVVELVSSHVGESHTVVEGTQVTQAKASSLVTQEKVSINGREIHLG